MSHFSWNNKLKQWREEPIEHYSMREKLPNKKTSGRNNIVNIYNKKGQFSFLKKLYKNIHGFYIKKKENILWQNQLLEQL